MCQEYSIQISSIRQPNSELQASDISKALIGTIFQNPLKIFVFYRNTRQNYARNIFESASLGIIHTFAPFWISTWFSVPFNFKYEIFKAGKIRNLLLVTSYWVVQPEFILSFPKPIFWINSFGIFFKCSVLLKMGRVYHSRIVMIVYLGDWWLIFTFNSTLICPGDAPTYIFVMVFPVVISKEGRLTLNVGIIGSWPGVLDWRKRRELSTRIYFLFPSWTCNVEAASGSAIVPISAS